MRSVSGGLNRTLLAICGLVFTTASAWVLLSGLNISQSWPTAAHYLTTAHDHIGAAVSAHAHWLLPTGAVASICAFLVGLILLALQVPRKVAASPLRLSGSDGKLLATLSADVLSQALSERAQTLPGVERCTVWVTGSPNKLWLQADASVSKDCEVEWAVAQLRKQFNDDIATSLGAAPKQIDLLVRLARSTSAKSVSKTVTGQRY
ncbi:hypothetical protein [Actinomyces sp.]